MDHIFRHLKEIRRAAGRLNIKVSLNPFMPKPHTPLQWAPMEKLQPLRKKIRILVGAATRFGVEVDYYDPRLAQVQTVLSRGSRELGRVIAEWGIMGGGLGAWRRSLKKYGVRPQKYLGSMEEGPWERAVDIGLPPKALERGYRLYLEAACEHKV